MAREEGVHEGLEIRPPPLRQRIADLPVLVDPFAGELRAHGRQSFIQTHLKAVNFVVCGLDIIPWSEQST